MTFKIKRGPWWVPSPSFPLGPVTRPVGHLFCDEYLMVKEHPITLSASKVLSVLSGRRSHIQRTVKAPKGCSIGCIWKDGDPDSLELVATDSDGDPADIEVKQPFGVGDRLWVKEAFSFSLNREEILYRASSHGESIPHTDHRPWLSPVNMPRWASRLVLEVTGIRPKRTKSSKKPWVWVVSFRVTKPSNS